MKTSGIAGAAAPKTRLAPVSALAVACALAAGGAAAHDVAPAHTHPHPHACPTAPHLQGLDIRNSDDPAELRKIYAELRPLWGITDTLDCHYGREDTNHRAIVVHSPALVVKDDWVSGIAALHEGAGSLGIYVHAIDSEGNRLHPHPLDHSLGIFTTGDAPNYLTGEESHGIYARHTGEGLVGVVVGDTSIRTTGDYAYGVYALQEGSYRFRRDGSSTRARGAVVVNLVESARDRESRARPLVATRGDYADAVRAEYTGAAAFGHVAVNVEGYAITTGGILLPGVVVTPRNPGRPAFDPMRPWVTNKNYDPNDPDSPQYYNVHLSDELNELLSKPWYSAEALGRFNVGGVIFPPYEISAPLELRPHTLVYLPVRNPDYDASDPDSREFLRIARNPDYDASDPDSRKFMLITDSGAASDRVAATVVWNGRYFRALDPTLAVDAYRCENKATQAERETCFKEKIYDLNRDSGNPTGFESRGIYATHQGHGDIRVGATDSVIMTWGVDAPGIYALHTGKTLTVGEGRTTVVTPGGGGVSIKVDGARIATLGEDSHGVQGVHRGDSGRDPADGAGVFGEVGDGGVVIELENTAIGTEGRHARGVYGLIQQTCAGTGSNGLCNDFVAGTGVGDIVIDIAGSAIVTGGGVPVVDEDGDVTQEGGGASYAVHAEHQNEGDITVTLTGGARAETAGDEAHGVFAEHRGAEGDVAVTVDGGSVTTKGADAHGVYATHGAEMVRVASGVTTTTRGAGAVSVTIANGATVATEGADADAVLALHGGAGALTVDMTGGAVTATGAGAHGLHVTRVGAGTVSIDIAGGAVRAEGDGAAGVLAYIGRPGALHARCGGAYPESWCPSGGGSASARGGALADGVISIEVGEGASVFGGAVGIQLRSGAGADSVQVDGTVIGRDSAAIYVTGGGMVTIGKTGTVSSRNAPEAIHFDGEGAATARVAGRVEGGVSADGALTFESLANSMVTGAVHSAGGAATIQGTVGRLLYTAAGSVTVAATGRVTGVEGEAASIRATAGDLAATVAGTVMGDIRADAGALTFVSRTASTVTGTVHDPAGALTVQGTVGRLLYTADGAVTVAATGRVTGVEGEAASIRATAGDLTATVAGTVMGDIRADAGALTFVSPAGGTVTGTVHDPASPLTVHGTVGRLLYSAGGTVTVAATGRVPGVMGESIVESIVAAGDLRVALVKGALVSGDIRAGDGRRLDLDLPTGSRVEGTIHNPANLDNVRGTIGRLILNRGGTLEIPQGAEITGVRNDDGELEAIRNTGGDLTVTATGAIGGHIVNTGAGALMVTISSGMTGDIRGESSGAVTATLTGDMTGNIRAASGDLTVTVESSGTLTGGILARGGDLAVTVSGTVTRDIRGGGAGEHRVDVERGGTVEGTIYLDASAVDTAGSVGSILYEQGGTVSVQRTGRIAGIDGTAIRSKGGDLVVDVASGGRVESDILGEGEGDFTAMIAGMVEADIRKTGAGSVSVTVSGNVMGDIEALGASELTFVSRMASTVTGTVRAAEWTDEVTVEGQVGRLRFDEGGRFEVGETGEITGVDDVAAVAESGELVATVVQAANESRFDALKRAFDDNALVRKDGEPIVRTRKDGEEARVLGAPGTPLAIAAGARDHGVMATGGGEYRLGSDWAPRARLYEALPSALLVMNAPPEAWDRARASRDANGAWGRYEAGGGGWRPDSSTTGVKYDHRRWGARVGLDVPVGGEGGGGGAVGVSAHRVEGLAVVEDGGDIETVGMGVGLSASWRQDGMYADAQAVATWYESDIVSVSRGALHKDLSGRGYALGVEAGRRIALPDDAVLVPRARVTGSAVTMSGFSSDAANARVFVDDARSVKGRLGVRMEAAPAPAVELAGSLDLEHELAGDIDARVAAISGPERHNLDAEAEKTWVRVGLSAAHGLDDGAVFVEGQVDYARSMGGAWDIGGGLNVKVRF